MHFIKDSTQHMAALFYIGSALGVVFAGDLVTLYFFWEIMAVASTFLILARKTEKALAAGTRYVLVHIFGGLVPAGRHRRSYIPDRHRSGLRP